MKLLLLLCLTFTCYVGANEPQEGSPDYERHEKLVNLPYSPPPPNSNKTRLLLYEYELSAITSIHNPHHGEETGVQHQIKARYHNEILHHDKHGCMLIRYQVIECITGHCEDLPDVYLYIIQGGRNVLGVFVKSKDPNYQPTWNLMLAIGYAGVSPAAASHGDEQLVKTINGHCHYTFARPEDKVFTRKMEDCQYKPSSNNSLIPGMITFDYQHFVEYKQNKKIDADIVFTEADEQYFIQSRMNPDFTLRVHSHLSLEMMNRTRRYMKRYCSSELTGDECATQVFGATFLGKNWAEVRQRLDSADTKERSKLTDFINMHESSLAECTNNKLCPSLFQQLCSVIQTSSESEIEDLDTALLKKYLLIVYAIGTAGLPSNWEKTYESLSSAAIKQRFVNSLAFTTAPLDKALKRITKWIEHAPGVAYGNTYGYLVRRRCHSSPSLAKACNKQNDPYLKALLENKYKLAEEELTDALLHLPYKMAAEHFSKYLCSSSADLLVDKALSFFEKAHTSLFDRSINMKLLNIFRNTCPKEMKTPQSVSAMKTLTRIAPKYQTVGSYMLRCESDNPMNHDLWHLFYKQVQIIKQQENKEQLNYWNTLRSLRPFRPNYLQRSLVSNSTTFHQIFDDTALPFTVSGHHLVSKRHLEETKVSLETEKPMLSMVVGQKNSHLEVLGYGFPITTEPETQNIAILSFSKPMMLFSGLTADVQIASYASLLSSKVKQTKNVETKLDLLLNADIELFADQHSFGKTHTNSHITGTLRLENADSQRVLIDSLQKNVTLSYNEAVKHTFAIDVARNICLHLA